MCETKYVGTFIPVKAGSHDPILLKFEEVTDTNQHFYELKQCQGKVESENRIV